MAEPVYDNEDEEPKALSNLNELENEVNSENPVGGSPDTLGFSGLSSEILQKAENNKSNPGAPSQSNNSEAPVTALTDTIGKGFNPADKLPGGIKNIASRYATKKNGIIGGGVIGTILVMFTMIFNVGAFELVHIRENIISGKSNGGIVERVQQRRRQKSITNILKSMATGKNIEEAVLKDGTLDKAMTQYGFSVARDANGALTKIGFKDGANDISHDLAGKSPDEIDKLLTDLFSNSAVESATSKALKYNASSWIGQASKRLWTGSHFNFRNWLETKVGDTSTTETAKIEEKLASADAEVSADTSVTRSGAKNLQDPKANTTVNDTTTPFDQSAAARANPSSIESTAASDLIDASATDAEKAFTTNDTAALKDLFAKMSSKIPGDLLAGGAQGISLTSVPQNACRLKGTLNFISSVQNVAFALELARFSVKFLTAADHQKAGILQTDGLKTLLLYMHRPNPNNGKSAMQSGGMRYLMGDRTARVSSANLSKVTTSRNSGGLLAALNNWVNTAPGISKFTAPGTCKLVNNGLVQAGAFLGGALATVFGGEFGGVESNIAATVSLQVGKEVAYAVITPILIKTGAHLALSGVENGELVGDGLASGAGALGAMNAGANGLRAVTKTQAVALRAETNADKKAQYASLSLYDRYLNMANVDSLASTATYNLATTVSSPGFSFMTLINNTFSKIFSLRLLTAPFTSDKVSAATSNDQCNDRQALALNIETDPFCNPVLAYTPDINIDETRAILTANNDLDPVTGNQRAGSDFANYIDDCLSGRTGILYAKEVDKNGGNRPESNHCVDTGSALPGDTVGQNDRYTAYYGFLVDKENFVATLGGAPSNQTTQATTASPGGYKNPFRSVSSLVPTHIDEGVDYSGRGPVYALGNAVVNKVNTNSQWPGGDWIQYKLSDGPAAGKVVYMAESCTPTVKVGQNLTPDTQICNMFGGTTSIEIGWAQDNTTERAMAADVYKPHGVTTGFGQNFSQLLQKLGAPPGHISSTGISPVPIPVDWPTW